MGCKKRWKKLAAPNNQTRNVIMLRGGSNKFIENMHDIRERER